MKLKVDGPPPDFKLELTYKEMCLLVTALQCDVPNPRVTPEELATVQNLWSQLDNMIRQFK